MKLPVVMGKFADSPVTKGVAESRKWRQNYFFYFYVSEIFTQMAQKCNGNQRPFKKRGESEKPYE
jgi:hypothetical protein